MSVTIVQPLGMSAVENQYKKRVGDRSTQQQKLIIFRKLMKRKWRTAGKGKIIIQIRLLNLIPLLNI